MKLNLNKWTVSDYNNFIDYLYSLQDIKYKEFHSKLIVDNNLIGIRIPILRNIAKAISMGDYTSFIKLNKHSFYEEIIIHGFILGYINEDFNTVIKLFDEFTVYVNNWAICDCVVSSMKIFNKHLDEVLIKVKEYINNNNPWINRVGYIILLDYFVNDLFIDQIFGLIKSSDHYYVKMSIAWLLSVCYIKYKSKTLTYLNSNFLDDWTYNKTIQKIIESNRLDISEKKILKGMKK